VAFGQRRVFFNWSRLVLPNGRSLRLDREPAGHTQGYSGLQDRVERHWGGLFGMAALSTVLSAGAELGSNSEDDLVRAFRRGGVETFNRTGQQAVGQALSIAPTLTIRPGAPVRIIVTRDLVLEPTRALTMTEKMKLAELLDDTPVKLTIELPASVHRDLVAYGEALAQDGGRVVEPVKLAPAMLARFTGADRAFVRRGRKL
jgi:hypothetical protein